MWCLYTGLGRMHRPGLSDPAAGEARLHVTAPELPLTSLANDIATVRTILAEQSGPTILVGHSYGGAVISGAGNDAPNVAALVYISGFGMDEGESLDSLSKQGPAPAGAAQIRPDDQGFLWIDLDGFAQAFAADLDPLEAQAMARKQRPLHMESFTAKSGPPAWKHLPSWYLISTDDQMIPPQAQEMMAQRMGAVVRRVPSSHADLVSHPNETAAVIISAVEQVEEQLGLVVPVVSRSAKA